MQSLLYGGIDEAGLGPMLGPLCFGFVGFSLREEVDFWDLTSSVVIRDGRHKDKLSVGDSKKIYPGANGFEKLEQTVLAFSFAASGSIPRTLNEFLGRSPVQTDSADFDLHPWYQDRETPLPRKADLGWIEEKGSQLREILKAQGVEILALGSRAIPEAELNRSFADTSNKSMTHFTKCAEPLRWLVEKSGHVRGKIQIDRHGMRARYAPLLSETFPSRQVWIEKEKNGESYYRIEDASCRIQISFLEKGESKSFSISLASIFAKYTRELLMERWNCYFSQIAPGVKPTAGYYSDARRYLSQAGEAIRKAQIPEELLVRSR